MTDQHHLYTTGRFEISVRVPPDACPAPTDQALDEASRRLRFRLPGAYRDFVKVCGAGTLAGYFRISAPCPDGSPWDLRRDCRDNRGYLREWADDNDQLSRYAADLMPFGTSPYGDILAWLRSEANAGSGECPVYIVSRDDSAAHRLSDDFTGFLDEVCGGAKLTEIFNFSPPFSGTHDFERAPAIRVEPAAIPQVDAGRWIPAIPLRDALAYPGVAVPLFIGRPRSIRAIEQAMMSDTPLVLPFQKDPQREDADEVHGWGCLAWVHQVLKLPDQSMKALIGAIGRARIDDFRLTAELAEVKAETVVDIAEDAIDPRIMHEAMQCLERRARERGGCSEDELLDMLDECSDDAAELERNLLRYANPDTGSVVELLSISHRSQRLMRLSAA